MNYRVISSDLLSECFGLCFRFGFVFLLLSTKANFESSCDGFARACAQFPISSATRETYLQTDTKKCLLLVLSLIANSRKKIENLKVRLQYSTLLQKNA